MDKFRVEVSQYRGERLFQFIDFVLPGDKGTRVSIELFCTGECDNVPVGIYPESIVVATREPSHDAIIQEALEKVLDVQILLKVCS